MKSITVAAATLLLFSAVERPVLAQTLDPVQQLLSTRACSGCNLSNVDLSGQDLSAVNLQGATLNNANLQGANLSGADFSGARLYLTNLNDINGTGTNFSDTNLTSAKLSGADLTGANLTNATLAYAAMGQATLTNADLSGSRLNDADLQNVIGRSANLQGSSLNHTNLSNADFSQANFTDAMLMSAQLTGTDLSQANLEGANLTAATLEQTTLTGANLAGAKLDKTRLADGNGDLGSSDQRSFSDTPLDQRPSNNPPLDQRPSNNPPLDQRPSVNSPIAQTENTLPAETVDTPAAPEVADTPSPLIFQQFQQPTAYTLPKGTFAGKATARLFSLSSTVAGEDDTAFYPHFGFSYGLTDDIELGFSYQQADSNSPGQQGPFIVTRTFGPETPGNDELTLTAKGKIYENDAKTLAVGAVGALSFTPGTRRNSFTNAGVSVNLENRAVVPEIQVPVTATLGDRTRITLSPTVAFFPERSALFSFAAPGLPGSFGTTFGLTGAVSHQIHPRVSLWGDAFVPFTGNNTVSTASGQPNREIAFNAGVRYRFNPRLALDVFATNAQGSVGPLALTTQPDSLGVGANLVFLPELFASNRRIADNNDNLLNQPDSPRTIDGLGFFDGGTIPKNRFALHLQGGPQGFLSALRYGALKDFEVGAFLDYITSNVDESEQGISAKIRILNQDKGAPVTLSIAGTLSQTNNVFTNFDNNNSNQLADAGLGRNFPFVGLRDDGNRTFIATASLPVHYRINDRANAWFTPTIGAVQRSGIEAFGFNIGGEYEVVPSISVVAELGVDFVGQGNAFSGTTLVDRIPFNVGLRIDPALFFNRFIDTPRANRPHLEVYLTNRVGSSPWHQLRVREQNDVTVGAGILIPF